VLAEADSGHVQHQEAETSGGSVGTVPSPDDDTGVSPELLERLRPYLAESLMVMDRDWTVKANLAPPGGLIGRGLGLGVHTLEDMHPDDVLQILELGVQAFSTEPGWQGTKVVRMRTGDGSYAPYEITAINRFDDPLIDGMVVRTREVPRELTEDLTGLQRTSAIETLAELLPIGVLVLDTHGKVVFTNETACGMLSREPEELKRDGLEAVIAEDHHDQVAQAIARLTAEPGREEGTVRLAGARADWVACRFSSEGDPSGRVGSVVVTLEDVTERRAAEQALEARANHDALTGLLNRASLHTLLAERLAAAEHTVVAFLDLDGFKAVNDTWGHERGDHFLVAVADVLRAGPFAHVEAARMGGDEFVVVADACHFDGLTARLTCALAEVTRTEGVDVTGSVGIAIARPGDTPDELLRRADEAMYAAKPKPKPERSA
jgi:diguanylate cyclase (GGDEF)-like protein/PAS domain S-box-containing protein